MKIYKRNKKFEEKDERIHIFNKTNKNLTKYEILQ